ncbi:hypothetical protein AAVH_29229 [Aphelenchoides avenae]|nr:hypothetical protein AAVH_29229 [Aphelenchus avenae]
MLDDADGPLSDFSRLVKAVTRYYESWPFFVITSGIDEDNSTLISIDNPEPHLIDQVRKNSTAYKLELSLFAKRWAQATGKSLDDGVLMEEVEEVARLEEDIADIVRPTAGDECARDEQQVQDLSAKRATSTGGSTFRDY